MEATKINVLRNITYYIDWECPYCKTLQGSEEYEKQGNKEKVCFDCRKTISIKWEYDNQPKTGSLNDKDKPWCMCTKLESVYRDGYSTCSVCEGKDAYGTSSKRPADKQKGLAGHNNKGK